MTWDYDRTEILADAVVHGLGIVLGLIAIVTLVTLAGRTVGPWELTSVSIYGAALLSSLGISAAYNLWPVSPLKWRLRRLDHSAIFLLIAGTYTPFLAQMKGSLESSILLAGVWLTSLAGIVLKLRFTGRFDRLAVILYLAIGWSGAAAYDSVVAKLPATTLVLIAAGGVLYTAGVAFHLWRGLRFQNAIWHAFVLAAAACHYGAVFDFTVIARA